MKQKKESKKKSKTSKKTSKKKSKTFKKILKRKSAKISQNKKTSQKKVSTGIPNLDAITQKGFEKNSTNLITGSGGSGKSIFSLQFLMDGVKKKEKCLYISFEESKETFYANMKELGWDLEKLEKQGDFFFLEYTPRKVQAMIEEGGGIIESLVLKQKITRIVMDSLASFAMLFKDEIKKRQSILNLFSLLKSWDCTSILTYEGDFMKDKDSTLRILEFDSDSIILLYFTRNKKERERYLEVLKMRGTDHSKKLYEFEIGKGGIKLNKHPINKKIGL